MKRRSQTTSAGEACESAKKKTRRTAASQSSVSQAASAGEDYITAEESLPKFCAQGSQGTAVLSTQPTQVLGSGGTEIVDSAEQRCDGTQVVGSSHSNKPLAKKGRKANPGDISQITGKEVKPRNRKKKSTDEIGRTFKYAMSFRHFCPFVKTLTEKQRADVRSIGFGGLLHIDIKELPVGLVRFLVDRFDHVTSLQHVGELGEKRSSKSYEVSSWDVLDILQLPRCVGGSKKFEGRSDADLFEKFKAQYPYVPDLSKTDECPKGNEIYAHWLEHYMTSLPDGGDEFKRLFAIYSLSYILKPNKNHTVDGSFLRPLQDVSKIKDYNWCGYVMDELKEGVKRCQGGKEGRQTRSVSGCVLILVISYLSRFSRGQDEYLDLPLVQYWDGERIFKRDQSDLELAGKYGTGQMGTIYPISRGLSQIASAQSSHIPVVVVEDEHKDEDEDDGMDCGVPEAPVKNFEGEGSEKNDDEEFVNFRIRIPDGYRKESEIRQLFHSEDAVKLELWKRNLSIFMDRQLEMLSSFRRDQTQGSSQDVGTQVVLSQKCPSTGACKHPELPEDIEESKWEELNEYYICQFARQTIESQMRKERQPLSQPSFDLGFDTQSQEFKDELERRVALVMEFIAGYVPNENPDPASKRPTITLKASTEELIRNFPTGGDVFPQGPADVLVDDVNEKEKEEAKGKEKEEEANSQEIEDVDLFDDDYACSIDCGERGVQFPEYSSGFMRKWSIICMKMKLLRKQVVDYVFSLYVTYLLKTNSNDSMVYINRGYCCNVPDLRTLDKSKLIDASILDNWAAVINEIEMSKETGKMERFCFNVSMSTAFAAVVGNKTPGKTEFMGAIEVCFDLYIGLDLKRVFQEVGYWVFPVHFQEHYTLYIIDCKDCIVYHTDDLVMQEVKVATYIERANALKHEFSKFWVEKGFSEGADFNGFSIKHVQFPHDHEPNSHNDCGVYVMHQMQHFRGKAYKDYILTTPSRRMRFRAGVLATLVLCDSNLRRDAVISAATDLYENRDVMVKEIKKRLEEKKKKEDEEKKKKKEEEKKKKKEEEEEEKKKKKEEEEKKMKEEAEKKKKEEEEKKKKKEEEIRESLSDSYAALEQQKKKVAALALQCAEEEQKKKKEEELKKSKGGLKIRLRSSTKSGGSDVTTEKEKLSENMARDVEMEQAESDKNYEAERDALREARQAKKKDAATLSVVAPAPATAPAVGGGSPSDVTYKRRGASKPPLAPKK